MPDFCAARLKYLSCQSFVYQDIYIFFFFFSDFCTLTINDIRNKKRRVKHKGMAFEIATKLSLEISYIARLLQLLLPTSEQCYQTFMRGVPFMFARNVQLFLFFFSKEYIHIYIYKVSLCTLFYRPVRNVNYANLNYISF